ncbi:hypothetical protein OHS70_01525 [Streptomyces sp. NBC_00390]
MRLHEGGLDREPRAVPQVMPHLQTCGELVRHVTLWIAIRVC